VHRNPAQVVTENLDLARMDTDSYRQSEITDVVADRGSTSKRGKRTWKRRDEAIASRVDLVGAKALEAVAYQAIVL
jgi:hypothetical protein